jgi:orotate phosphoribosyltransferase
MIDRTLATDIRAAALLQGQFRLRSGQVSSTYFDKYRFEADPVLLKRVAAEMIPLLPRGIQVLAGLELGGVPIATAISLATGIGAFSLQIARCPMRFGKGGRSSSPRF